jgi:hypothetical protein
MLYPQTPRRERIFAEIDASLKLLGWDTNTARGYIKQCFGCISRQQLDDGNLDQLNRQLDWAAHNVKTTPQNNDDLEDRCASGHTI